MATTYLVDYENVHDLGMNGIHSLRNEDMVYIIYTDNANRISLDCFNNICVPVSVIKVECGDQSLDMHLVSILGYLIGRENDPDEAYVIVSQDSHYLNISQYWCDRYNNDNKVVTLPSICGKPIHLISDRINPTFHDIAADRIRTIIKTQGIYGDEGMMMLVSTLCANMNEHSAYIREKRRLNLKGMKLLATFGDVIDIRQINNTDWAVLKNNAFYKDDEDTDETETSCDICEETPETETSCFDIPAIDNDPVFEGMEGSADDLNDDSESSVNAEDQKQTNPESECEETISDYNIRCRQLLTDAAIARGYTAELAAELASVAFSDLNVLYKRIDIYYSFLSQYGRVKGTEYYKVIKWMRIPEFTGIIPTESADVIDFPDESGSDTEVNSPVISDSCPVSVTPEQGNDDERHDEDPAGDVADRLPDEDQTEGIDEADVEMSASEGSDPDSSGSADDCPIESMGLSVRAYNCLQRAGFHTAKELIYLPDEELIKIRYLGQKGIAAIRDWCAVHMKDRSDD